MKKAMLIAVGFAMGAATMLCAAKAFSAGSDFSSVTVTAYQNTLVFFDKSDGSVYAYGTGSGKLAFSWKVSALGEDLEKVQRQGQSAVGQLPSLYTVE